MDVWALIIEPMSYGFMQRAMVIAALVGAGEDGLVLFNALDSIVGTNNLINPTAERVWQFTKFTADFVQIC